MAAVMMSTPQEEERAARRAQREGEAFRRRMERSRDAAARRQAAERRREARRQLDELLPERRRVEREYVRLLKAAGRERRSESVEDVNARFDEADRAMSKLMGLCRRERRLREGARG